MCTCALAVCFRSAAEKLSCQPSIFIIIVVSFLIVTVRLSMGVPKALHSPVCQLPLVTLKSYVPLGKFFIRRYVPEEPGFSSQAVSAGFQLLKFPAKKRRCAEAVKGGILPVLKTVFCCPNNKKFWQKSKNAQKIIFFFILKCQNNGYFSGNVPGNWFH